MIKPVLSAIADKGMANLSLLEEYSLSEKDYRTIVLKFIINNLNEILVRISAATIHSDAVVTEISAQPDRH